MELTLYNKNTPIADLKFNSRRGFIYEMIKVHNPEYAPLGLVNEKKEINLESLSDWWEERSIPDTRKDVEKILEYIQKDKNELIIQSLGLSLSDQYWIQPVGSKLNWKDINFFTNNFPEEMGKLFFDHQAYKTENELNFSSPDLTANGFLNKRWAIDETNNRILLKSGYGAFNQQPYNEKIASDILKKANCKNYVTYELYETDNGHCSVCENFINENTEYIPASLIRKISRKMDNESEYDYFMRCCKQVGIKDLMQKNLDYILPFDYLIANIDRNYGNFGVIRNVETLKIETAAPIFDNGNSLWYDSVNIDQNVKAYPFKFNQDEQIKYVKNIRFPIDKIRKISGICIEVLALNNRCASERISNIVEGLESRQKMLNRILAKEISR